MMLIQQLLGLLSRREHWQLGLLLFAMIVQAAAELVGVASIAPFMSVAADPSSIERSELLRWVYDLFGFSDPNQFLIALGVAVVGILALSNGVSAAVVWATLRFSAGAQHRLAMRLVEGYLAQPYSFFLQQNTARLHKNVLGEVKSVINGVLNPLLILISRGLVVIAIAVLLTFLDPRLAALVVSILGGAYGLVYVAVRRKQRRLGQRRVAANQARYKATSEAFIGVKDVKVLQRERDFLKHFRTPSLVYCLTSASNSTISRLPRYLLETLAFGGIILIVLYYLGTGRGVTDVLPILSLYAFAGYRLMPSLQQVFSAGAQIRFNRAALDDILEDLHIFKDRVSDKPERPLPFTNAIRVQEVTFRYPDATEDALTDLSLTIKRNETVGLVGPSGAGKTTLVDLLLGLYEPSSGRLMVDDCILDSSTIPFWRLQVGYVPQHIFLSDDTIARNIAFGVPEEELELERIQRAARIAHLHDFVQTLPDGYNTKVGERGMRLSGGQQQRIGIARALYHDPEVLVMDEATSALDGVTEDGVMEAIHALAGKKTIILIAHRLTTVRSCDRIFLLDGGTVCDIGDYETLIDGNKMFRSMSGLEQTLL